MRIEDMLTKSVKRKEKIENFKMRLLNKILGMNENIKSYATTIKKIEQYFGQISTALNQWQ